MAGACDAAGAVGPGSTAVDGFSAGTLPGVANPQNRIRATAPRGFRCAVDRESRRVWPVSGRTMAVSGSSANQGDHADPDQQEPETHLSGSPVWWAISGLGHCRAPADQVR